MAEAATTSATTTTVKEDTAATIASSVIDKISKVPPVYSQEEIYRYIDLGLGRGLDGTDPTPWLNKSSFQVRRVTYDNILGTEEGGAVQSYEREISSVHTQQTKIKSSIVVPKSPLTIGTDSELSRSVHTSRRAIGRKVINRTISFKDNFHTFDGVPFGDESLHATGSKETITSYENMWTFEQRLAHWILEKLKHSWQDGGTESIALEESQPTSKLQIPPLVLPSESSKEDQKCPLKDLLFIINQDRSDDLKLIAEFCHEFVTHFRITHYVKAIELGATEYRVFTEDEYQTAVSLAGTFGIEKLANLAVQQNFSNKRNRRASDLKRIGVITSDDKVERGSYGEAVINVHISSIVTLIKSSFLHKSIERALVSFVDTQSDRSDGPFIISCGATSGLYLVVDSITHQVTATTDISTASEFHIIPTDNIDKANEFYIGYYEERTNSAITTRRHDRRYSVLSERGPSLTVPLYLDAPLNIWSGNRGPLRVWNTVAHETSRFVLHSRIVVDKGMLPIPLSSWTSGSDMFYVNCSRRKYRRDAYLTVKRIPRSRDNPHDTYITACMNRISYHDDNNVFMLFQLLPVYLKENVSKKREESKTMETSEGIELQATSI